MRRYEEYLDARVYGVEDDGHVPSPDNAAVLREQEAAARAAEQAKAAELRKRGGRKRGGGRVVRIETSQPPPEWGI